MQTSKGSWIFLAVTASTAIATIIYFATRDGVANSQENSNSEELRSLAEGQAEALLEVYTPAEAAAKDQNSAPQSNVLQVKTGLKSFNSAPQNTIATTSQEEKPLQSATQTVSTVNSYNSIKSTTSSVSSPANPPVNIPSTNSPQTTSNIISTTNNTINLSTDNSTTTRNSAANNIKNDSTTTTFENENTKKPETAETMDKEIHPNVVVTQSEGELTDELRALLLEDPTPKEKLQATLTKIQKMNKNAENLLQSVGIAILDAEFVNLQWHINKIFSDAVSVSAQQEIEKYVQLHTRVIAYMPTKVASQSMASVTEHFRKKYITEFKEVVNGLFSIPNYVLAQAEVDMKKATDRFVKIMTALGGNFTVEQGITVTDYRSAAAYVILKYDPAGRLSRAVADAEISPKTPITETLEPLEIHYLVCCSTYSASDSHCQAIHLAISFFYDIHSLADMSNIIEIYRQRLVAASLEVKIGQVLKSKTSTPMATFHHDLVLGGHIYAIIILAFLNTGGPLGTYPKDFLDLFSEHAKIMTQIIQPDVDKDLALIHRILLEIKEAIELYNTQTGYYGSLTLNAMDAVYGDALDDTHVDWLQDCLRKHRSFIDLVFPPGKTTKPTKWHLLNKEEMKKCDDMKAIFLAKRTFYNELTFLQNETICNFVNTDGSTAAADLSACLIFAQERKNKKLRSRVIKSFLTYLLLDAKSTNLKLFRQILQEKRVQEAPADFKADQMKAMKKLYSNAKNEKEQRRILTSILAMNELKNTKGKKPVSVSSRFHELACADGFYEAYFKLAFLESCKREGRLRGAPSESSLFEINRIFIRRYPVIDVFNSLLADAINSVFSFLKNNNLSGFQKLNEAQMKQLPLTVLQDKVNKFIADNSKLIAKLCAAILRRK